MTGSRVGLAVLSLIALALAIAVAIDHPAVAVRRSARLAPGFDPAAVTSLRLARGDGDGDVEVARADGGWRVVAPPALAGPADAAAVADVLGAIELAAAGRWVDRAAAQRAGAGLDAPRVIATAGDARIAIGADAATGQVWAEVPGQGRAALVEAWVARALDRDAAALRRRAVVTTARPTGVEVHAGGVDVLLSGAPLRVHLAGGVARVAPAAAAAVTDALASLRLETFPAAPAPEPVGTVRVLGGAAPDELDDLGPCPGDPTRRWLGGSAGAGCVDGAAWAAALAAAAAIAGAPGAAPGAPSGA